MNPDHDDQKKNLENNNFKGCLSHSQIRRCSIRFLGSRKRPRTQTSSEGTILDNKHDDPKVFWILENFGKFRNKIWVPPNKENVNILKRGVYHRVLEASEYGKSEYAFFLFFETVEDGPLWNRHI